MRNNVRSELLVLPEMHKMMTDPAKHQEMMMSMD